MNRQWTVWDSIWDLAVETTPFWVVSVALLVAWRLSVG